MQGAWAIRVGLVVTVAVTPGTAASAPSVFQFSGSDSPDARRTELRRLRLEICESWRRGEAKEIHVSHTGIDHGTREKLEFAKADDGRGIVRLTKFGWSGVLLGAEPIDTAGTSILDVLEFVRPDGTVIPSAGNADCRSMIDAGAVVRLRSSTLWTNATW